MTSGAAVAVTGVHHRTMPTHTPNKTPGAWVSIASLALTVIGSLVGASVTVGIFYSKVNTISEQIQEISKLQLEQAKSYQETREAVSTLRAQRDADRQVLTDIKSDVNEIRNSQLKYGR